MAYLPSQQPQNELFYLNNNQNSDSSQSNLLLFNQLYYPTQSEVNSNSYSPESISSTDTNLISPPQHYYPDYPEHLLKRCEIPTRPSSVPPQFHSTQKPVAIKKIIKEPPPTKPILDSVSYQRQLDQKLAKIDFDDITVAELKETLRERGLPATGRKAELMQRLRDEHNLVVHHKSPHGFLNKRIANLSIDSKKRSITPPPVKYSPYSTPPLKHSTLNINPFHQSSHHFHSHHLHQHVNHRMASSVPTHQHPFLNDQFMNTRQNSPQGYYNHDPFISSPMMNSPHPQPNVQLNSIPMEDEVLIPSDIIQSPCVPIDSTLNESILIPRQPTISNTSFEPIKQEYMSPLTQSTSHLDFNSPLTQMDDIKLEEDTDVWDDQMLELFLNQI